MHEASEKLTRAVCSLFSTEISETLTAIHATLDEQGSVNIHHDAFRTALRALIHRHTWHQSHRLFVYEFHAYRRSIGLPVDPNSSEAFDAFRETLDEQVITTWFERYGLWKQMISTCVRNTLSFLLEVARHFSADVRDLMSSGLIANQTTLTSIIPLDSDPHNGSKVVLALEFDGVPRVIYKPRSLALDVMIRDIFTEIVRFPLLGHKAPVPLTLDRGNHGWQEQITVTGIKKTELTTAYRKLGLCSAVLTGLGATDIHDENVLFSGSHPWFIDLETGMHGNWQKTDGSLAHSLEDTVARSLCTTSVIPAKLPTTPKSLLIGAINTSLPQTTTEKVFTLRNPASDAVDIARSVLQVTREQAPLRLATGEAVDPVPYQGDFVAGYQEGYRRVIEVRDEIIARLVDADFPVRKILRPTAHYAHFLSAALFAENLASTESINRVLGHIKIPPTMNEHDGNQILLKEKAALLAGDIPFAYSDANGTSLKMDDHETGPVFAVSPAQNAIDSLRRMSEERLRQDERIIAEGFSYIRAHDSENCGKKNFGHPAPMFKHVVERMTAENPGALVELLITLAVHSKSGIPEIGWLNGTYGDAPISYHSTGLISLHDSGGLVFLFEQLEESSDPLRNLVPSGFSDSVRRGLLSLQKAYRTGLEKTPPSIISGIPSIEFVLRHTGRRLPVTEKYVSENFWRYGAKDLFAGELGLAVALATFPETPNTLLHQMHAGTQEILTTNTVPNGGLAHGRLGVLWAAVRLARRLGDRVACQRAAHEARQLLFPDGWAGSGWCNGRAGTLLLSTDLPEEFREILPARQIAESVLSMPEGPIDLAVCHGAGGILQALLHAARCTKDPWFVDVAHDYWMQSLEHARRHGFYVGEPNKDHMVGYLLGWGGVAHSAVLLRAHESGDPAWAPISLTRSVKEEK